MRYNTQDITLKARWVRGAPPFNHRGPCQVYARFGGCSTWTDYGDTLTEHESIFAGLTLLGIVRRADRGITGNTHVGSPAVPVSDHNLKAEGAPVQ